MLARPLVPVEEPQRVWRSVHFASFPLFALVFVGATVAATAFRRHAGMRLAVPVAAVVLGLVQGAVWGSAGAERNRVLTR